MTWTKYSPWDGSLVWSGVAEDPLAPIGRLQGLTSVAQRREALERLALVLQARRAEAVELLIREAGKVRRDAEAEADLLPQKIATTLADGWRRCPPEPQEGIVWRPRGLAAVIGPANFPLHLLHGLVVPAVAMGNPVVAKPSERTPALGAWYRSVLQQAGLDPHVAVVLGGAAEVATLVRDPRVVTVAAVGGRAMGQALLQAVQARPEVVLALELGGIGHVLVAEDADLSAAIPALAEGAWRQAGQRCNATRVVHVPSRKLAAVHAGLQHEREAWKPGTSPEGWAGPLIDPDQRARFLAGVAPWMAGEARGYAAVDPVLVVTEGDHPALQREHFGPLLALVPYDEEEVAVARMAANPARLSAAVWTTSQERWERLIPRLPYGLLGRNRSTSGARGDRPFGGCGQSGNGRPAGVAACALFADETVLW